MIAEQTLPLLTNAAEPKPEQTPQDLRKDTIPRIPKLRTSANDPKPTSRPVQLKNQKSFDSLSKFGTGPRINRNGSNNSLKLPRKLRPKPILDFSKTSEATFQEIARLVTLNDENKIQIQKLTEELKTLKIVNALQERGLQTLDKEKQDFPKVFKSLNEELRIAKMEKQKASERVLNLERMTIAQSEEYHKLHGRYKELKQRLKLLQQSDVEQLRQENISLEIRLSKKELELNELHDRYKFEVGEKDREMVFAKHKAAKYLKELDIAKSEIARLSKMLSDRDKVVNSLAIYARHAGDSESDASSNTTHKIKQKKHVIAKQLSMIEDKEESVNGMVDGTPVVTVANEDLKESHARTKSNKSGKSDKVREPASIYKPKFKGVKFRKGEDGKASTEPTEYPDDFE